jgi:hypothetical protein
MGSWIIRSATVSRRPLIVAVSLICAASLYAQAQQPDTAELKANAQRVISIIQGDDAKIQAYCEMDALGDQISEAEQKKDDKQIKALAQHVAELEKKLGPEFSALVNDLSNVDPNSPEAPEMNSILAPLAKSCPH